MPSTQRVKNASIFIDGRKQATMQETTLSLTSNDAQEIADGGIYITEGVITSTITCSHIVPIQGVTSPMLEKMIRKEEVDILCWPIEGKRVNFKGCRFQSIEFSSQSASGRQSASYSWFAGAPEVLG